MNRVNAAHRGDLFQAEIKIFSSHIISSGRKDTMSISAAAVSDPGYPFRSPVCASAAVLTHD